MRREWLEGSPMLEVTERRLAICRFLEFPFLYVSCSRVEFPLLCDFSHASKAVLLVKILALDEVACGQRF